MSDKLKSNNVKISLNSFPSKIFIENNKITKIEINENNVIKTIKTNNHTIVSTIPIINLVRIMNYENDTLIELAKKLD